jgi:serine phosphatase RsbU (regulator of sigma subunit)
VLPVGREAKRSRASSVSDEATRLITLSEGEGRKEAEQRGHEERPRNDHANPSVACAREGRASYAAPRVDQQTQYLKQIAQKVDDLLSRLASAPPPGSGAGASNGNGGDSNAALGTHVIKLASILDPQELLTAIMDSVIALTGAQRGFLMMIEENNKLRFKIGRNVDQQSLSGQEFGASRTVIKQVITGGEPVLWDSSSGSGDPSSSMKLMGLKSVACVPLKMGMRTEGKARVGGVIYVDSTGVQSALTQREMKVLAQLADQAAVAIENAQIFQNSERERSQISRLKENIAKLYEVGRQIGSTLVLDDLLVMIVDNVVSLAQAQRGFVMLIDEEKDGTKQVNFKVGRDSRQRTLAEEHFAFSTTIARKTIDEKKSQMLTSALGGEGESASVSMVEMKLQSIMCVPLIEKDKVVGLVYVDSQQETKEFGQSDVEVIESLCGQAAVAVTNAKLYGAAKDKERIAHELHLGAKIQSDLLPKQIPQVDNLEIYGFMKPAKEVGGDYYDFIPHEGTKRSITVCIGDVSGKGVGAGLVMAMARSALRSLVQRDKVPKSTLPLVQGLNNHLCGDIPRGMFMTVNVLNWDADAKKLRYTPAGHEHILIYRVATKTVERIKAGGVACGVLKQSSAMMKEKELDLKPGDQVVLYTDGVTEAMDKNHKEFELRRLELLVKKEGHRGAKDLCDVVYNAIEEFRGEAEVHDDITLVALKAT